MARDQDNLGKRPATIYTVADDAGVSIATVSRVAWGHSSVAEPTVRRVREAMRRTGYRPNGAARALATQRHGAIGLVFPHLSGPYYAAVLQGVEAEATAQGVNLAIIGTHGRGQAAELVTELGYRVDGLLVMGRTIDDRLIADLQAQRLAVVVVSRPGVGRADIVCTENRESAAALAVHLIEHGHRQIAFIGDPGSSPDAGERWEGFRAAHRERGLAVPMRPVISPFREVEGRSAALQALATPSRPTALFCANDEIAMGAYAAAAELGLTIPTDVAITGWDDIPVARLLAPRLTTVRQPMAEIGERATRLLLERIGAKRQRPLSIVLPTEIIIRSSCGCQS
jgi:LacI family transcriptional regulator